MRVLSSGSLVVDSVARDNSGTGLLLGPGVGYARNAISGSSVDVSGGQALGCNLIGSSAVCPP
jgi:hypothetical protein